MKRIVLKRVLYNNTKIIATLGPASRDKKTILSLIREGVDVFRINFSHDSCQVHGKTIDVIHQINRQYNLNIPIIQDLQGPKIRTGDVKDIGIPLEKDHVLKIMPDPVIGDEQQISISFSGLYKYVHAGEKILLDDGKIELLIIKVKNRIIYTRVLNHGFLYSRKGVNLPHTDLPIGSLTQKDKHDIEFGLKKGITILALSFVRSENDIKYLRKYTSQLTGKKITIIAKIEKPQAVRNINGIMEHSDGIMIARGDLGVEIEADKVPVIQKKLIQIANLKKKFVITATQMLESMMENPIPTRAETTDVFNAVLDGTDAVMLSGETSIGKFPVRCVKMMKKILKNAEQYGRNHLPAKEDKLKNDRNIVSECVFQMARSIKSRYIVSFTNSGATARLFSKTRPDSKILAFTPEKDLVSSLPFYYAVFPFYMDRAKYAEDLIHKAKKFLTCNGLIKKGERVIISLGTPLAKQPQTNTVIIYTI